jgi:hypothetical protein
LGAAFVALLLLSGDLGGQASAVTDSRPGQSPLELNGLGYQLSATSESRAGWAPILPGGESQAFWAEILTPLLGLELRRPNFDFQLFYGPRLYWEHPNATRTGGVAPLVLHSVGLAINTQPSQQVILTGSATGSLGNPDYTSLPQVLGTIQGYLPPIEKLASIAGQATVRYGLSRRWELEMAASVFHYQLLDVMQSTIDAATAVGQPLFTSQTTLTEEPGATLILTPRDSLGLGVVVGESEYSDGVSVLIVTPTATWKSRLTRRDNLKLTLGFAYGRSLATPAGAVDPFGSGGSGWSPIGSAELVSRIARYDGITIQSKAAAGVDYYVDPILGNALPRGTAGAGLTVISIPDWTVDLRGDFGTVLRAPPVTPLTSFVPDETAFSITLSTRRRISENLFGEVGILWADRGPALSDPDFHFHQRQLWLHVSVTGTTKPISRQVQPQ